MGHRRTKNLFIHYLFLSFQLFHFYLIQLHGDIPKLIEILDKKKKDTSCYNQGRGLEMIVDTFQKHDI